MWFLFSKETGDKKEKEKSSAGTRFYGPASNCKELGKLGYTLNGYYLVNGSKTSNQIVITFCRFKLPPGENESNIMTMNI